MMEPIPEVDEEEGVVLGDDDEDSFSFNHEVPVSTKSFVIVKMIFMAGFSLLVFSLGYYAGGECHRNHHNNNNNNNNNTSI